MLVDVLEQHRRRCRELFKPRDAYTVSAEKPADEVAREALGIRVGRDALAGKDGGPRWSKLEAGVVDGAVGRRLRTVSWVGFRWGHRTVAPSPDRLPKEGGPQTVRAATRPPDREELLCRAASAIDYCIGN